MKRGGSAWEEAGGMGEQERSRSRPGDFSARATSVPIKTIVAAFIISRVAASGAGVRFALCLDFHQFLDRSFLSSNLLQSIYYLHSQPPLLNFLMGIGLKLFHESCNVLFATIFAAIGLVLAITMYSLMVDLRIPPWISLVLTVLFEISPATLLFENLFYDTYPTAALLCLAAFFLNRFLRDGTPLYGTAFAVALAIPVFLNSSFQIIWFVGVGGILCLFAFDRLRKILPIGFAMLGLILLLYLKNFFVFGSFTTSSASGMAISAITTSQLSHQEREELVRAGELSRFATMPLFPMVHVLESARTGIPALDEERKPDWSGGGANCNSSAYLQVAHADMHDALWVIVNRPQAYARGVRRAIKSYFEPATADLPYLQRKSIKRWCELYEPFLEPPGLPRFAVDPRPDLFGLILFRPGEKAASTVLLIALPVLALFAVVSVLRALMTRGLKDPGDVTLLFIVLVILYLTPLGILVTFGENNRYRYVLDPLYVVLFGLFVTRAWSWLATQR
jgi:hypothetical protein